MSEERPYRYFDEARAFGESLAEIKVAAPEHEEKNRGALERIATGNTALGSMPHSQAAAAAGVPDQMQRLEVRRRLQSLLAKNKQKLAARDVALRAFCLQVKQASDLNPNGPDVTPNAMTSGTGVSDASQRIEARLGIHQGPAANFFAKGLKALKNDNGEAR